MPSLSLEIILFSVLLYALVGLGFALKHRLNSYKMVPGFFLMGAFIYGDVLPLSVFWILVSIVCFVFRDLTLFYLILSLFWLVRSVGETLYWFLMQFSPRVDMTERVSLMPFYHIVKNDSVWIIYQVVCQCVTVVTLITSVKLFVIWLGR